MGIKVYGTTSSPKVSNFTTCKTPKIGTWRLWVSKFTVLKKDYGYQALRYSTLFVLGFARRCIGEKRHLWAFEAKPQPTICPYLLSFSHCSFPMATIAPNKVRAKRKKNSVCILAPLECLLKFTLSWLFAQPVRGNIKQQRMPMLSSQPSSCPLLCTLPSHLACQ